MTGTEPASSGRPRRNVADHDMTASPTKAQRVGPGGVAWP